jgi:hypothetical protein
MGSSHGSWRLSQLREDNRKVEIRDLAASNRPNRLLFGILSVFSAG